LKIKSHKIQRLELVLNKIETGNSKRKVVCIRFGCPMKKMALVESSHGRVEMTGVGAPWPAMRSSREKERRGR
jgi:hypothetical protein